VVGTDFIVYDYAEGRHFGDVRMPKVEPADRTAIMTSLLRTLGR
jgi:predicted Ser/Thr protein kinase